MKLRDLLTPTITAAFAFGRFNPCHKGHIQVWETVQQTSKNWYIGTNPLTAGVKDPLIFEDKRAIMEALYPQIRNHVIAETSVLTLASKIYEQHSIGRLFKINVAYITDDKDWQWSGKLLNEYNGKKGPHGFYHFNQIFHVPSPRIGSATELRAAVLEGNKHAFYRVSGISPSTLFNHKSYFDIVSESIQQEQQSKYRDTKLRKAVAHASAHYPQASDEDEALMKLFHRSLEHSKHDDELLKKRVKELQAKINKLEKHVRNLQLTQAIE